MDNLELKRRACLNLVRPNNRKINIVRFSPGESEEHIKKKREICNYLDGECKSYVTEAIIQKGDVNLRADILILDDCKVLEIAVSESEESLEKKRKLYESIGLVMEVVNVKK